MEGKEQEIPIEEKGQYKNISPKKDLTPGNYIIVEKTFAEGRRIEKQFSGQNKLTISYNVGVKYKDQEVSFFLKEKEHEQFVGVGQVGEKIKIVCVEKSFVNEKTRMKMVYNGVEFEKL